MMSGLCRSSFKLGSKFLINNSFSTSTHRPAFPPILLALSKPVAKVLTVILGKGARTWWKKLPDNKKYVFKQIYQDNRKKVYTAVAVSTLGLGYAYESHVQECAITGRRRFVALTPDQAKRIGEKEFRSLLVINEGNIVPESNPVYGKVAGVANQILQANKDLRQIYDKTWTLTVVDDTSENAFVLPSGNIFVLTGMLKACETLDELGIVLSHEIAHVVLGHVEEKLTLTSFVQLVLLIPMAVLWAFLPNDGIALVFNWFMDTVVDIMIELPFSRDMETEADRVGLILAAKACIDVREAPVFWGRLKLLSEDPSLDKEMEFSSTHPCHETRQETLTNLLKDALHIRHSCGCTVLDYNRDPMKKLAALAAFMNSRRNTSSNSRSLTDVLVNQDGRIVQK
ncbi:metalloendopeptidase OMA1, mitochondrial [Eurytemora carolleeae]|uniref:metalloendopeptidase OMA1, mitochondrial n=1 Tax=Eurytemora carolleeae TaxID=1294199 RepID=UPI000C7718B9|nr:metalloendopeptidase OMA1, mitochondrial [Eurytemora carolleeae]|eukprot:XP_023325874.1 metalloendopeptidase OMA1, mitochondrial-like [Eurytemora affinis]